MFETTITCSEYSSKLLVCCRSSMGESDAINVCVLEAIGQVEVDVCTRHKLHSSRIHEFLTSKDFPTSGEKSHLDSALTFPLHLDCLQTTKYSCNSSKPLLATHCCWIDLHECIQGLHIVNTSHILRVVVASAK